MMEIYNVILIGIDTEGRQIVNSYLAEADNREHAEEKAKPNAEYFQQSRRLQQVSTMIISFDREAVRELINGEAPHLTFEQAEWPDEIEEISMGAKDYKNLASAKRTDDRIIDVTVPSGYVWKMKEPPIQQFLLAGKLPASLTSKMSSIAQRTGGDPADIQRAIADGTISVEDVMANLAFGRDLLLHCAVEPRISRNPTSDDEIAPEDILPEDFSFLLNWCFSGGKSGESLTNFRPE